MLDVTLASARRYGRSPYLLLWRTLELQAALALAAEHAVPLRTALDLDIGCGDGQIGTIVTRRVRLGIDLDAGVLRLARRESVYRSLAASAAGRLPIADASMRLVFSNSVLEHIPDDQAVLAEIARVLQPGGHVVLTLAGVPLPGLALGATAPSVVRHAFDASLAHVHYYTPASITAALGAVGVRVLGTRVYMDADEVQWWHRLRAWEGSQPRRGMGLRLAQISRLPASLAVLGRVLAGPGQPAQGGGLAVVARKEAG